jgi:hypothetical protein
MPVGARRTFAPALEGPVGISDLRINAESSERKSSGEESDEFREQANMTTKESRAPHSPGSARRVGVERRA